MIYSVVSFHSVLLMNDDDGDLFVNVDIVLSFFVCFFVFLFFGLGGHGQLPSRLRHGTSEQKNKRTNNKKMNYYCFCLFFKPMTDCLFFKNFVSPFPLSFPPLQGLVSALIDSAPRPLVLNFWRANQKALIDASVQEVGSLSLLSRFW